MGPGKIAVLNAMGSVGELGQRIEDHPLGREHQPRHDRDAHHGHADQDRKEKGATAGQFANSLLPQFALAPIEIGQHLRHRLEIGFAQGKQHFGRA